MKIKKEPLMCHTCENFRWYGKGKCLCAEHPGYKISADDRRTCYIQRKRKRG